MIIVVRTDLNMRKGKMCAQVAHAAMSFLTSRNTGLPSGRVVVQLTEVELAWLRGAFTKIVVGCKDEAELLDLVALGCRLGVATHRIMDNGATEFHGVLTLTCAAFGPDLPAQLDPFLGHLKLL